MLCTMASNEPPKKHAKTANKAAAGQETTKMFENEVKEVKQEMKDIDEMLEQMAMFCKVVVGFSRDGARS